MTTEFARQLIKNILSDLSNCHPDNFDDERFPEKFPGTVSDPELVEQLDLAGLENTYNLLADERSKQLLVKLIEYKLLGWEKVILPTNTPEFWKWRKTIPALIEEQDVRTIKFGGWKLSRFNLSGIGFPIRLEYVPLGILATFCSKQYEYNNVSPPIKVRESDIVIDAGGCWGDTALYFASMAGSRGRVYTFEFIPSNLEIMRANLNLNDALSPNITIVENPVWSQSDQTLFCIDNGPGSRVSSQRLSSDDITMKTVSIDDFIERRQLDRVDFIKMDIEGAELATLKGAEQVLRKFRPQLAVSVYHRPEDLVEIPRYLASLDLGYEFYLGHHTIHLEETILYARTKHEGISRGRWLENMKTYLRGSNS